jgi:hypothetical protein
MRKNVKTAVCLYGFLRTFRVAGSSLLENVVKPNNADLFIFTPNNTGTAMKTNIGLVEKLRVDNPAGEYVDEEMVKNVYAEHLKAIKLYSYNADLFEREDVAENVKIIGFVGISRVFSMFYNIKGTLELLENYEKTQGIEYENIILTRPDIAFYSKVDLADVTDLNKINIANGLGEISKYGTKERINSPVFFCKNTHLGILIEANENTFNDQIIIGCRNNIMKIGEIYNNLRDYRENGIPMNPETLIFYHLHRKYGIEIDSSNDWKYEIFREDTKPMMNIYDIEGFNKYKIPPREDSLAKFKKHLGKFMKPIAMLTKPPVFVVKSYIKWLSEIFSILFYLIKIIGEHIKL